MQEPYKDRLASIDYVMFEALKEVFNTEIERERPEITEMNDNNQLGEKYRAYLVAKRIIDKAFLDIKSYKTGKPEQKGFAKER